MALLGLAGTDCRPRGPDGRLRRRLEGLQAAELFYDEGLELVQVSRRAAGPSAATLAGLPHSSSAPV